MKHNSKLNRSRWLLLTLFTLLVGISPAWGDAYTTGFESTDGWTSISAMGGEESKWSSQGSYVSDYELSTTYKYQGSKGLYNGQANNSTYFITPKLAKGTISFWAAGKKESGGANNYVRVYKCTDNGDGTFTIDTNNNLSTHSNYNYSGNDYLKCNKNSLTYTQYSFELDEDSHLAFYISKAGIDNFSASNGLAADAPAGIGVYTDEDCTASVSDGVNLSYGLVASAQSRTYYIKNESGEDWTNLAISHSGNAEVTSVSSNLTNDAKTSFTVSMAASGSTSDEITITAGEDLSFTINVSGTVKDPNKVWCDFTSDLPSGWDNTGGWAISNSGADGITSGGGYASNTTYDTNKRMFTPLVTIAEGEKLYLMVKGHGSTASWNKLYIQYSANGTDWTTAKSLESITNTWQSVEVTEIPAGNWYIGFYGSYVHVTDIYGGTESTAPVLSLSQTSYDFGLIDENTISSTITITNSGPSELTGMNLVSSNAAFTFNVTDDATTIAANGGTATFTVTMSSANAGTKNGTITIKSDNADDLVLNVSGAVMKAGTTTAIFNDATLAGWTKSGNTSFNEGETAAYFYYLYTNYLTSPKVTIVADDFLAVNAKMAAEYGYVTVQGSIDGSSWTDIKKLDSGELNQSDYTTAIVSGISTDYKYLRLNGYYCYVKQVAGLTYAPVLVVKDAENAVQASPVAYAFGEQGANASVTYSFTNGGTGTLNITNVAVTNTPDDGTYTTNWAESVATPFDLVITQNYDAEKAGAKTGSVVVTMSDASTFTINLSGTLLAANAPTLAVDNTLEFGKLTANDTQTVTVTNSGTGSMTVDIVSDNALFTVSPAQLTEIGAGASKTFDVTFHYDQVTAGNYGVKNANITVTPTYNEEAAVVISASAKAKDPEEWSEDFAGNAKPDGWEITNGTYWKIQDGVAKGSYSYGNFDLYTPSLVVEEGATLTFDYRMTSTYRSLDIQYSKDNGAWTNYATISYSGLTLNQWYTYTIENLTPGKYKFRFGDSNYDLDNFQGFKRNMNDPKLGIYSDEECTVAVATSVTTDLGFATTDQIATYYIKNDGTGTMTLSKGDDPLTITMPAADNVGYHSGNIVVTATDLGTFTVAANGVIRDANKLYLDFSSDNIPATWTANNWTKNGAGYIENSTYSSGSVETAILTAEAGEDVVIEAKMYSSYNYTLGVNYKKQGDAEWSTLIEAANIGTEWTKLRATIADAGKYQLQFVGTRAQIRRIYGLAELNEPVMVVYDGEVVAGSTYNFGNVSDEADATWTLTVKNEGKATLTGLAAALSGTNAAHYSVEVSATELAVNATTTITVKQLKDNIGAHSATLTISADDLDSKVIALSGTTRDHTKLYLDFEDGNFPATWTNAATNTWTINTQQDNKYLRQYRTATSAILTSALTIANDEVLKFDAKSEYNDATLTVRYTTNGGTTWTEYATYTYNNGLTGTFDTKTISGIPAGTVMLQFDGMDVGIDNVYGFAPTTAPMLSLTESAVAVASGSTKEFGNLTEAGTATYTLSNTGTADLVSTVATTGVATAAISGEGEGVTISENTVTLEPGKSATITLTLPYEAPYGEKSGAMTISSEGWVANMVVNYTATTIDPTALYVDFNDNAKPAGWYNSGWTITGQRAANYSQSEEKSFITSLLTVEGTDDVLTFDAQANYDGYTESITVSYSTDRKNWTPIVELDKNDIDGTLKTFDVKGLAAGNYYLKISGKYVYLDNIMGWHYKTPAPEHDLYVSSATFPTTTLVPETVAGVNATATVYSLRANETGVYAKLFFDETVVATAEPKSINLDASANFTLTGNVPATEKTYAAKIVVYYSNNSVAWETDAVDVEVAHTRTLSITEFTRDGEGEIDANASNQFSAAFNVTVQNTGSTTATPVVKIFIGETEVGSATADAEVAAGKSKEIAVNVTNASAGEGGNLAFTAKAFWTAEDLEAKATSASDVIITVNAAAPMFAPWTSAS